MKEYLNFDLEISRHSDNQAYLARVIYSTEGEGRHLFNFPFNHTELQHYLHSFAHTRGAIFPKTVQHQRLPSKHEMAGMLETFGKTLFDAVFQNDVESLFRAGVKTAQQAQLGLRLRLRFADVPELINIPWEYLFDQRTNTYLSLAEQTSVVRYIELPSARKKLQVTTTINILVIIANPSDYAPLDTQLEQQRLDEALAPLVQQGEIIVRYLDIATMAELLTVLASDDFHIIHFIGHGSFDQKTQQGQLIFEDEHQRGVLISSERFATALQNEPSLRLIVLNSCEGGITSANNIFAGVAQGLVKKEIPAVLAMQYEITDDAAIVFATKFYNSLVNGKPVDTALSDARQNIYHLANPLEFGTPALYMRAARGKLFGKKSEQGVWHHQLDKLNHVQHVARFIVSSFLFLTSLGIAYGMYQWVA